MNRHPRRQETLSFTDTDFEWVCRKWAIIRDFQQKADNAFAKSRRINDELNDYLDRNGVRDIVQRANIRQQSIPLLEAAEDLWAFRREAQAHMEDLNLYLKLKEVGLL